MNYTKTIMASFTLAITMTCLFANAQATGDAPGKIATDVAANVKWAGMPEDVIVGFGGSSTRFARDIPPVPAPQSNWKAAAWKGEKIHTQLLVASRRAIDRVQLVTADLRDTRGHKIPANNISVGFVQYVMTDEFKGGCGYRKSTDFDSSMVADIINTGISSEALSANTVQPVWLTIKVPATAIAGNYTGTVVVKADKEYVLNIKLDVIDRQLPPPSQWKYQLDLWQHPAAIARVHNIPLWSEAHFAAMKKYYTMLAEAGQKNITASIVNEPWGHQTYDDYPGLIKWTRKKNGSWQFDYSLFDRYISFVMSCGINERINCYSMVPWKIAFSYYDEAMGRDTVFTDAIGTAAYNTFWTAMLKDFTKHLKEKKWFAITCIAMDERPLSAMQSVIALLKSVDANWKVALAGNYHPEIEKDIYDYCIASALQFPKEVLERRKKEGKISTWYTCCTENFPNGFTFSPPDEHVWIGWYTAAAGMDGYLRWAYNSWTKDPLKDSRFTAWPAGDTYQVYPGPLTSIRFEKMIEGIQDYEKIEILRKEYSGKKQHAKLAELEAALAGFSIKNLSQTTASAMLAPASGLLNK